MKNNLESWRLKKTWSNTLCLPPVYYLYSDEDVEDTDLSSVCSRSDKLTLDLNSESGFSEVGVREYTYCLNKDYEHLLSPIPKFTDKSVDDYITDLRGLLRECFIKLWDSDTPHIISHSGGRDSRILSYILAELRDVLGRDWLGKVHFVCHEPEGEIFRRVMKRQGWDSSEYSVFRDGVTVDYYDIGNTNVNGFWNPGICFYNDVIPYGEEQEWCLVSGNFGGEQFYYRAVGSPFYSRCTEYRIADLYTACHSHVVFSEPYYKWGDILQPYMYYPLLEYSAKIPDEEIITTERGNDNIRDGILSRYGDDIGYYVGHIYNHEYTKEYRERINEKYISSSFYKDYSGNETVRDARPGDTISTICVDTKLYGLSTMYELVQR